MPCTFLLQYSFCVAFVMNLALYNVLKVTFDILVQSNSRACDTVSSLFAIELNPIINLLLLIVIISINKGSDSSMNKAN